MNHKTQEWFQNKLGSWLKKDRLLILLLSGVLLLVISIPTGKKNEATGPADTSRERDTEALEKGERQDLFWGSEEAVYEESYRAALEKELEELLMRMDGARKVRVMITLEQSMECVVLTDSKSSQKQTEESSSGNKVKSGRETITEENVVCEEAGKGKSPYVVKKMYPKVRGVVVAAQGAGSGRVSREITEALQALLGLEAHKVKVLKLGLTKQAVE